MKYLFTYIVLALVCLSFTYKDEPQPQFIHGLKKEYRLCDSIGFELKNPYNDSAFLIIAVERKEENGWSLFQESICKYVSVGKTSCGHVAHSDTTFLLSWYPCRLDKYAEKEYRYLFKGTFRFAVTVTDDTALGLCYSDTFNIVQ